jgi:hypothetical protein
MAGLLRRTSPLSSSFSSFALSLSNPPHTHPYPSFFPSKYVNGLSSRKCAFSSSTPFQKSNSTSSSTTSSSSSIPSSQAPPSLAETRRELLASLSVSLEFHEEYPHKTKDILQFLKDYGYSFTITPSPSSKTVTLEYTEHPYYLQVSFSLSPKELKKKSAIEKIVEYKEGEKREEEEEEGREYSSDDEEEEVDYNEPLPDEPVEARNVQYTKEEMESLAKNGDTFFSWHPLIFRVIDGSTHRTSSYLIGKAYLDGDTGAILLDSISFQSSHSPTSPAPSPSSQQWLALCDLNPLLQQSLYEFLSHIGLNDALGGMLLNLLKAEKNANIESHLRSLKGFFGQ